MGPVFTALVKSVDSLSVREKELVPICPTLHASICFLLSLITQRSLLFQVFTWNTDAWGFGPGTTSLYQSHPWVLAVLPSGESLGILADTTRRCEVL